MKVYYFQPGGEEWSLARAGIPTASEFKNLVTINCKESKAIDDYSIVLAAEKFSGRDIDSFGGNRATERGQELEPDAIAFYEMKYQVVVDSVGFITNDLKTYGCSPDGLVGDNGSIEVKCKIAKEHIKVLLNFNKTGRYRQNTLHSPRE